MIFLARSHVELSSPVLFIADYFQEHTLALSGRRSCKKAFKIHLFIE